MAYIAAVIVGEIRTFLEEKQSCFDSQIFDDNLGKELTGFNER